MSGWTHFQGCNDVESVRFRFKKLAKQHHPDLGGDVEVMKAVNAEYEQVMNRLNGRSSNPDADPSKWSWSVEEKLREALQNIILLKGISIEIIGVWIWVGGDTKIVKDQLKSAGFLWSKKNQLWYFAPQKMSSKRRKNYRGRYSMDDKRNRYGSRKVK